MHMSQSVLPADTVDAVARGRRRRMGRGAALHDEHRRGRSTAAPAHLRPRLRHRHGPRRAAQPRRRPAHPGRARSSSTTPPPTSSASASATPSRCSVARAPAGERAVDGRHQHRQHDRLRPHRGLRRACGATPSPTCSSVPNPASAPTRWPSGSPTRCPDTTVQTRAEFARQEANVVRDMASDVMQIMTVIGFLIALAVIGLTLFTATLAKLREYGVVKALGAGSGRLAATVAAQAAWSVALGLVVAVRSSSSRSAPPSVPSPRTSQVAIEPGSVIRTGSGRLARRCPRCAAPAAAGPPRRSRHRLQEAVTMDTPTARPLRHGDLGAPPHQDLR